MDFLRGHGGGEAQPRGAGYDAVRRSLARSASAGMQQSLVRQHDRFAENSSAMKYHFLTGATGLLGAYLLRDNLRAGRRLAVLCRAEPQ